MACAGPPAGRGTGGGIADLRSVYRKRAGRPSRPNIPLFPLPPLLHNDGLPPRPGHLARRSHPVPDSSFFLELTGWFVFLMSAGFGNPIPEEIMIITGGIRTSQLVEQYG